jgi:hypothetical protein
MKASSRLRFALPGGAIRLFTVIVMLLASLATLSSGAAARSVPGPDLLADAAWQSMALQADSDDEDEEDEETPEDEEETPEDDDDTNRGDDEETPEDDDDTNRGDDENLNEDWVDAGLISLTEYESPMFGYTVEWTEPWVLDEWYDDPDNGDSAQGTVNTDLDGSDNLHIWEPDTLAILRVQGLENENNLTGEDYLEFWQSDDYYEGFTSDAEHVVSEGDEESVATIFQMETTDGMYLGYNELIVADDGDTFIFLFFLVPVDNAEDGYAAAQDGAVEVDGEEVFDVLRDRDVTDAIEEIGG